jgi:hypothetical protein
VGPGVFGARLGAVLRRLHVLVIRLVHVRLNGAFYLVDNFCLGFNGVFSLHFCSNSYIALIFMGHVEMTLFYIYMHVRNASSS